MAKIIAGIGTSHVPSLGAALDHGKTQTDYWKPLFDGLEPARRWIAETNPDVCIIIFNDQIYASYGHIGDYIIAILFILYLYHLYHLYLFSNLIYLLVLYLIPYLVQILHHFE